VSSCLAKSTSRDANKTQRMFPSTCIHECKSVRRKWLRIRKASRTKPQHTWWCPLEWPHSTACPDKTLSQVLTKRSIFRISWVGKARDFSKILTTHHLEVIMNLIQSQAMPVFTTPSCKRTPRLNQARKSFRSHPCLIHIVTFRHFNKTSKVCLLNRCLSARLSVVRQPT